MTKLRKQSKNPLHITMTINPMAKPRMTRRDKWAHRPVVDRYFAFCEELRLRWGNNKVPEAIDIAFTIPMPDSWSKKKREEMQGKPHQQRPDLDNYIKSYQDALLVEDGYIHHIIAHKTWDILGSITVREIR